MNNGISMDPEELKEFLESLLDTAKDAVHTAEEAMQSADQVVQELEDLKSQLFACNKVVDDPKAPMPQRCINEKNHAGPCESKLQRMQAQIAKLQAELHPPRAGGPVE